MANNIYDIPINEVAKILDKSDRQIRRYVKEKSLRAKPVRIDGHMKLMFNKDEVVAFSERFTKEVAFDETNPEIVIDAQLIGEAPGEVIEETEEPVIDSIDASESLSVKYAIDALKEQIRELRQETRDLHYQLEQRSGQVGFLQGKIESLQEEIKALMPAPKPEAENKSWFRRVFSRN